MLAGVVNMACPPSSSDISRVLLTTYRYICLARELHNPPHSPNNEQRETERERVKGNEEAEDGQRKRGLFVLCCEVGAAANLKRYKKLNARELPVVASLPPTRRT